MRAALENSFSQHQAFEMRSGDDLRLPRGKQIELQSRHWLRSNQPRVDVTKVMSRTFITQQVPGVICTP